MEYEPHKQTLPSTPHVSNKSYAVQWARIVMSAYYNYNMGQAKRYRRNMLNQPHWCRHNTLLRTVADQHHDLNDDKTLVQIQYTNTKLESNSVHLPPSRIHTHDGCNSTSFPSIASFAPSIDQSTTRPLERHVASLVPDVSHDNAVRWPPRPLPPRLFPK